MKVFLFLYKKEICVEDNFSATIATAPLDSPRISSPIINSDVVADGDTIEFKIAFGGVGSLVSADSKIA